MSVTISPTVAAVNAADKPYAPTLSAAIDFEAADYVWKVNGNTVYAGYGGSGTLPGPVVSFSALPKTVRLDVVRLADSVTESDSYTTADQRPAPTSSIELLEQRDGVPITDSVVPMTLGVSSVADEDQVDMMWSYGAEGEDSRSDVFVKIEASDETNFLDFVRVDWDDGNVEDFDTFGHAQTSFDAYHTYTDTTGGKTITATPYNTLGNPNSGDTLGVSIPTDATGWRASQYKITQYQDQLGFRETAVVGWRGITGEASAFRMYGKRRTHTYYFHLQLREVDPTGRPVNTSARSAISSVGPW